MTCVAPIPNSVGPSNSTLMDDLTRRLGTTSMRSETSLPQLPTEVVILILRNLSIGHLRLVCRRVCKFWQEVVDDIIRERLVGRCCALIVSEHSWTGDYSATHTSYSRSYLTYASMDGAGKVILRPDRERLEFDSGSSDGPVSHSISIDKLWEDVIFKTRAYRDLWLPFGGAETTGDRSQ